MAANLPHLVPYSTMGKTMPNRRELLWIAAGKKCHWCDSPTRMVNDNSWDRATTDHVLPRYKGGTNDPGNLVSACNRCNNRRCHEDQTGLSDGSLLGKYKQSQSDAERKAMRRTQLSLTRVCLTGDEKKALNNKIGPRPIKMNAEDALREQRDQALAALQMARLQSEQVKDDLRLLEKEHKIREAVVREQQELLKNITILKVIKRRLIEWLSRPDSV